ncbi:hypothetical protein [Kitasatospora sp. NBC_01539]|uniref:hypothetical protein n=1 Tax=Kitasatospora sp. NBC_01539 TaxID=2903577 RepID=UPI0038601D69
MLLTVITRFVRNAAVATAATAVLGAGLPLLTAGDAWACGDAPTAPAPTTATPANTGNTASGFIAPVPTSVTAGGAAVEIGLEQVNLTGAPVDRLAPEFSLFASEPIPGTDKLVNLQPEDVTLDVMFHGHWKRLSLRHGCDPTLFADTSSIAEPVQDGRAHRYVFRLALSAKTPAQLKKVDVYGGSDGRSGVATLSLAVQHPKTSTATPSPTGPAPITATGTPTATPTATRTPTPAASAPATAELAETGPSTPAAFLLVSGAVALALGGAVLYGAARISRR